MTAEDRTFPEPPDTPSDGPRGGSFDDLLDRTVDGVVRRTARRVPGRVAVRYADRVWTYAELDAAEPLPAVRLPVMTGRPRHGSRAPGSFRRGLSRTDGGR
ncbi:hypothetical protein [Streptomyces sp. NPDC056672]|uniref:hypothetical protein n=1 Tax=Streptomyces sp. NPDC056672 TaxID=3345906 RepID=UPI0036C088EE